MHAKHSLFYSRSEFWSFSKKHFLRILCPTRHNRPQAEREAVEEDDVGGVSSLPDAVDHPRAGSGWQVHLQKDGSHFSLGPVSPTCLATLLSSTAMSPPDLTNVSFMQILKFFRNLSKFCRIDFLLWTHISNANNNHRLVFEWLCGVERARVHDAAAEVGLASERRGRPALVAVMASAHHDAIWQDGQVQQRKKGSL